MCARGAGGGIARRAYGGDRDRRGGDFFGGHDASEISSIDLPRELDNCRKLKDALWRAIRSVCESEDTTQYALGLRTFLDLNIIKYH